jgi:beta-galactosidase
MKRLVVACAGLVLLAALVAGQAARPALPAPNVRGPVPSRHTFVLGASDFLLDGRPFQVISGEMHPARIPPEYWRHRIRMARAMGCNTIAAYIFWNHHETSEGVFDFTTATRDIARFVKIAQEEGMWVILRPGPYVCAEWDFGGIPPYLLREADL